MEALAKIKEGQKFSEVASAYSEDKARQGVSAKKHQLFGNKTQEILYPAG